MALSWDNVAGVVASGAGNLSWTHTGAASNVKGVVVHVVQNLGTNDQVTNVAYGTLTLTRVNTATVFHANAAAGKTGAVYTYVGTSGIPQGAQTVVVTVTGSGSTKDAHSYSIIGADDTIVSAGITLDTSNVGAGASASVTIAAQTNVAALAMGALHSGGTTAGAMTAGAGTSEAEEVDFGNQTASFTRLTDPSSGGNITYAWTVSANSAAGVGAVALVEKAAVSLSAPLIVSTAAVPDHTVSYPFPVTLDAPFIASTAAIPEHTAGVASAAINLDADSATANAAVVVTGAYVSDTLYAPTPISAAATIPEHAIAMASGVTVDAQPALANAEIPAPSHTVAVTLEAGVAAASAAILVLSLSAAVTLGAVVPDASAAVPIHEVEVEGAEIPVTLDAGIAAASAAVIITDGTISHYAFAQMTVATATIPQHISATEIRPSPAQASAELLRPHAVLPGQIYVDPSIAEASAAVVTTDAQIILSVFPQTPTSFATISEPGISGLVFDMQAEPAEAAASVPDHNITGEYAINLQAEPAAAIAGLLYSGAHVEQELSTELVGATAAIPVHGTSTGAASIDASAASATAAILEHAVVASGMPVSIDATPATAMAVVPAADLASIFVEAGIASASASVVITNATVRMYLFPTTPTAVGEVSVQEISLAITLTPAPAQAAAGIILPHAVLPGQVYIDPPMAAASATLVTTTAEVRYYLYPHTPTSFGTVLEPDISPRAVELQAEPAEASADIPEITLPIPVAVEVQAPTVAAMAKLCDAGAHAELEISIDSIAATAVIPIHTVEIGSAAVTLDANPATSSAVIPTHTVASAGAVSLDANPATATAAIPTHVVTAVRVVSVEAVPATARGTITPFLPAPASAWTFDNAANRGEDLAGGKDVAGTIHVTTGVRGSAIWSDSGDSGMTRATTALRMPSDFTVLVWAEKVNADASYVANILSADGDYGIRFDQHQTFSVEAWVADSVSGLESVKLPCLGGEWEFFAARYKASTRTLSICKNGGAWTDAAPLANGLKNSSTQISVGNSGLSRDLIDELTVFGSYLTDAEVFDAYVGGFYPWPGHVVAAAVNATAALAIATAALPTHSLGIGRTLEAAPATATASLFAPTVTAKVSLAAAPATASGFIPQHGIGGATSVDAQPATANASIPGPSAASVVRLNAALASASASIPAGSVAAKVGVSAAPANASAAIPQHSVSAIGAVNLTPSAAQANALIATPDASVKANVSTQPATASASLFGPSVGITLAAQPATAAASVLAPTFQSIVVLEADPAQASAEVIIPGVAGLGFANPPPVEAMASVLEPTLLVVSEQQAQPAVATAILFTPTVIAFGEPTTDVIPLLARYSPAISLEGQYRPTVNLLGQATPRELNLAFSWSKEGFSTVVRFVNTTAVNSGADGWIWDFGDSSPSVMLKDPGPHTYLLLPEGGSFVVAMSARRGSLIARTEATVTITWSDPASGESA